MKMATQDDDDNMDIEDSHSSAHKFLPGIGAYASAVTPASLKALRKKVKDLPNYSKSTTKKRAFIRERYRYFCHLSHINPVPFRFELLKAFMVIYGLLFSYHKQ